MPEEELIINKAIYTFWGRVFFCVYMKRKTHKYRIKTFQLCQTKSGYIYNTEIYAGTHPTDTQHNTIQCCWYVVSTNKQGAYCLPWINGFLAQSSLITCEHVRQPVALSGISGKLKVEEKIVCQRHHFLAIRCKTTQKMFTYWVLPTVMRWLRHWYLGNSTGKQNLQ
jgi:hypothetical protein